MKDLVFSILAEAVSFSIYREKTTEGYSFTFLHSDSDKNGSDLEFNLNHQVDSFESLFQQIISKQEWYKLHLEIVHEDYRNYIADELMKMLNIKRLLKEDINPSAILSAEKTLKIKIDYANAPIVTSLRKITISSLMKLTEFEYHNYIKGSSQKSRIKGKYELWTHEQTYHPSDNKVIANFNEVVVYGILEVNANTIIIKDEFDNITDVFPSDKYYVSTSPILSNKKSWFYTL